MFTGRTQRCRRLPARPERPPPAEPPLAGAGDASRRGERGGAGRGKLADPDRHAHARERITVVSFSTAGLADLLVPLLPLQPLLLQLPMLLVSLILPSPIPSLLPSVSLL